MLKKVEENCILDKENNLISGTCKDSKTFYEKTLFLPRAIENLLVKGDKPPIEYSHFSINVPDSNKYAGYYIYGCADTTLAKETMAYHLLDKYPIIRYDSTYYDTVYTITVLDDSKLLFRDTSCQQLVLFGSTANDFVVTDYRCISWGMICHSLISKSGMNTDTNSIEGEDRVGYYDVKIPAYIYRDSGLDAYQNYLKNYLGLEMRFERVDTIKIGVYEYRE